MRVFLLLIFLAMIQVELFSQPPNWSVDLSKFQFRMTVSAVVNTNDVFLEGGQNRLAVFKGDELRGTAYLSTYHEPSNSYLAIFQVGSNLTSENELEVYFYNEETNEIKKSREYIEFVSNDLLGTLSNPYIVSDNMYPDEIVLSNYMLVENGKRGDTIASLSALDQDDNFHFFELISISPLEYKDFVSLDQEYLVLENGLNYEFSKSLKVKCRATDTLGGFIETEIELSVLDINDAPADLNLSPFFISENSIIGTKIGEITVEDEDTLERFSYQILPYENTLDHTFFELIDNEIISAKTFDNEVKDLYQLLIRVEDKSGAIFEKLVDILVTDENEVPIVRDTSFMIRENVAIDTEVGEIEARDLDNDQVISFGFGARPNGFPFEIDSLSGKIIVTGQLDFENINNYDVKVIVSDNGTPSQKKIVILEIEVADQNEPPIDILLIGNDFHENLEAGSLVGKLDVIDPDFIDQFSISFIDGTSKEISQSFTIVNDKLISLTPLDYESDSVYLLPLRAVDKGGLTFTKQIELKIKDINETPLLKDTIFYLDENIGKDFTVGTLVVRDEDKNQKHFFYLVKGSEDYLFSIDSLTGEIKVLDDRLDYEQKNLYTLSVIAIDNGNPPLLDSARIEIRIRDLPERQLPYNNYISPNGDGFNDFLEIENIEIYEDFELIIYNENGTKLYQSRTYRNDWDGTFNNRTLPAGLYYFTFSNQSRQVFYKGTFYIKTR